MSIVWAHMHPVTTSAPYSHLYQICGGSLMGIFAGLLQRLMIVDKSEFFVEYSRPATKILARTVPSGDSERPCEPCAPICVITGLWYPTLGYQGRYGRRVMQGSRALVVKAVLPSVAETRIQDFGQNSTVRR